LIPQLIDLMVLRNLDRFVEKSLGLANEPLNRQFQVLPVKENDWIDQQVLMTLLVDNLRDKPIPAFLVPQGVREPAIRAKVQTGVVPPVISRLEQHIVS